MPENAGHGPDTEGRFREFAEVIPDVFWMCAADTGRVLYVSPAYENVWGRPPDAVLSGIITWPEAVLEEDHGALAEARRTFDRLAHYEVEYRIRRPDRTVRWIHDRAFLVPATAGSPARRVGVAADVTERRRRDAELLQEQKIELVGKLAGGIAHEFNNHLTIISGYVSLLLDKDNLPPAYSDFLKRVFTASRQATGLVRQLLMFSRKRSPRPELLDLNGEIEVIAAMLRRILEDAVVVDFEPAPEAPRVSADLGMLEQAIINLAMNARDAMPHGGHLGIRVSVKSQASNPQQPAAQPGGFACIAVRDSGCGIAAHILPRMFEPFFTTKDEGGATGLGLSTAKDIVKRHNGWIEVETEVGKGTAFRIYLPLAPAATAASPGPETGSPKKSKGTILLVEDETNVREFAAAVLQHDGYTLLQAKSGKKALEVWQWHSARIDLLLSDVVLPGEISGPQLCATLQAEKPALRVILTTGYGRDALDSKSGGSEPKIVLGKPYTPRSLLQAVREALA